MERRPVSESPAPRYPSYEDFCSNRRKFMRLIGLGAGVAALGGMVGCSPPQLAGDIVALEVPDAPACPLPGDIAVSLPGEMPVPEPPVAEEPFPALDGDISIAELPQLRGSMPVPAPPAPEPPAPRPTPRPPGSIKPPLPALGGVMIAPEPAS